MRTQAPKEETNLRKKSSVRNIQAYVDAITLYGSLKSHLEERYSFSVHIEPKLRRVDGREKIPDILIETKKDYSIIEHKSSLPNDSKLLASEIQDVMDYVALYEYQGETFQPDIILLTTESEIKKIREFAGSKAPTTLSYLSPIDDPIVIRHNLGGPIRDVDLRDMLQNRLEVPHDRNRTPMYKFIRAEPPAPYTATVVWQILRVFQRPFQSQYVVEYSTALKQCQTLFPPWLSKDAEQLTPGRLNKALDLLQYLGWVEWNRGTREITVFATKGTRVADLVLYFSEKSAKRDVEEEERKKRIEEKMRPKISPNQRTLEEFLMRK